LIYRRRDVRDAAASVLLFAPVMSLAISALTILCAPLVARAFDQPDLTNVLRAMTGVLLLRGVAVVPTALLEREMRFASLATSEITGTVTQVGVSVGLAFAGFEVWALVIGYLVGGAAQAA